LRIFARRAFRQFIDEPDSPRILVAGDALLHEVADLCRVGLCPWRQRDRGAHFLAEQVVGDTHHGRLPDGGVLVEDLVDLPRMIMSLKRSTMK
jgi:hypothetical protein